MPTMFELAKNGVRFMRRYCWEDFAFIEIDLKDGQLPSKAPLYSCSHETALCHIGAFSDYNDFNAVDDYTVNLFLEGKKIMKDAKNEN